MDGAEGMAMEQGTGDRVTESGRQPRALLLMGQGRGKEFHNRPEHWALLASILRSAPVSTRMITDDLNDLNTDTLARCDVILNFSTDLEATESQIEALLGAVRGGVGYVGLHAATATFWSSNDYLELVGSHFGRHDPIKRFRVEITDHDHPVTAGVPSYEIEDELYELKDVVEGLNVLANAEGHPMVYVKQYGQGRVCYIAPGHDRRSLERPEYAQLVHQAISWVAGANR